MNDSFSMEKIVNRQNSKAYYDPLFFTVFLPEYNDEVVYTHFGQWVELLFRNGIHVSGDYKLILQKQIIEMPRQPYPRLILNIPLLLSKGEKCDFKLEFYGGVLPICSGGFVQAKSMPLNEKALESVLDSKLANVVGYPVENDDECYIGPAWALYAHFKDRDWNRRSWAGIVGLPEIGKNVLTSFAKKFGEERVAFKYPSEIKQIRQWLEKCDSEMGQEVETPLTKLLVLKDMSVREWRKTRP